MTIQPNPSPATQRVGGFRFYADGQRWEWSDEVAALHGYNPGEVELTIDLLLKHKHPDDRDQVADVLSAVVDAGQPYCSRHRILDAGGAEHHVLVVSDEMRDGSGASIGTMGFYIDVSDTAASIRTQVIDEAMPEIVEARSAIEQAKGAVMAMYAIPAEKAFDVLVWRSQETNTKLRVLAEKLVAGLVEFGGVAVQTRTRFDHLLLTAHELPDRTADRGVDQAERSS
ncbi:PAS and ANTAR domain-containing protein [Nocardia sp. NBC_01329]|uniref:PAS and ANTAR domain-containing protein n=1 Tax=Nocardia sp. NBC_01329 TaxID=2903594 RepID=UPI002E11F43B|nr:PAS and ANTAR domain-containing protein [Nocardia sp. NBC_01329]